MDKKNTVPMLEKALDILEYIGASEGTVSLPELQENLGIAQASCYRIVKTLLQRSWLEKCSGNRYEIAPGMLKVAGKAQFRLSKYSRLQPAMNRLADQIGYSAKYSVLDGEEFVNVCSAQCRHEQLNFSEPGFRSSLYNIATVSTIFLAEQSSPEQGKFREEAARHEFRALLKFYQTHGYCFIRGETGSDPEYPFDTLSFPVRNTKGVLLGVVSFLSLPGRLEMEREQIAGRMDKALKSLINLL